MKNIRAYLLNAFLFSLFTNLVLNILQSNLAAQSMGKNFSSIFFFSTLLSTLALLVLSARTSGAQSRFHMISMAISVVFLFLFFAPFIAFAPLIFCAGLSFLLVDAVGPGVLQNQLADRVSPIEFQFISGKVLEAQLAAKAIASFFLYALAQFGKVGWAAGVACGVGLLHVFLFRNLQNTWAAIGLGKRTDLEDSQLLSSAFKFLSKNQLARTATIFMLWGACIKFLIDLAVLQATEGGGYNLNDSAKILSQISFFNIIGIFAFHRFVSPRILSRFSLSRTLSIVPIATLFLTLACVLRPSIFLVATLFTVNQALARSVHVPSLRHLFLISPMALRGSIYQLSLVFLSIATAVLSGALSLARNSWGIENTLFVLAALCILVFFLVVDMDQLFLSNLWRHYMQSKSGRWLGHAPLDLSSLFSYRRNFHGETGTSGTDFPLPLEFPMLVNRLQKRPIDPFEWKTLALACLETARGKDELQEIFREMGRCLSSQWPQERSQCLEIGFVSGLPAFRRLLECRVGVDEEDYALVTELLDAWKSIDSWPLKNYANATRKKIRFVMIDALRENKVKEISEKIIWLVRNLPIAHASAFLDVLYNRRFEKLREPLFACLNLNGEGKVRLDPLLKELASGTYIGTYEVRHALERIGPMFSRKQAWNYVDEELEFCERAGFRLGASCQRPDLLNRFQKALFLELWLLDRDGGSIDVRDTIWELESNESWKRPLLVEMYLTALKKGRRSQIWKRMVLEKEPKSFQSPNSR